MKFFLFLLFVGVAVGQQARSNDEVTIVKQYFEDEGEGASSWGFESSDGTERQEKQYFKPGGEDGQILVQEGFWTYYDSDARLVKVTYIADENGFQTLEDNRLVA